MSLTANDEVETNCPEIAAIIMSRRFAYFIVSSKA
jgi:hypothetical protein